MSQLSDMIAKHEGLRLKPYHCTAGKLTIGYGRNLDDVGITKNEAETMLINDIERVYTELTLHYDWFKSLDDVREAVIVDMCFNLGLNRLNNFKKTIKLISESDYKAAAIEMLDSKWAKQVGYRAIKLSTMMDTGEWQ